MPLPLGYWGFAVPVQNIAGEAVLTIRRHRRGAIRSRTRATTAGALRGRVRDGSAPSHDDGGPPPGWNRRRT
ncbi:hypothetical protein, partial [Arthrobacter sp. Br18]|uniref:hypothetical protein n=1 Tax=Arthrobacter sp. Br18 TaxID=1312954 RepID=UPI001C1DD1CA